MVGCHSTSPTRRLCPCSSRRASVMFRFSPPSGISQIRTCRGEGGPRLAGQGQEKPLLPSSSDTRLSEICLVRYLLAREVGRARLRPGGRLQGVAREKRDHLFCAFGRVFSKKSLQTLATVLTGISLLLLSSQAQRITHGAAFSKCCIQSLSLLPFHTLLIVPSAPAPLSVPHGLSLTLFPTRDGHLSRGKPIWETGRPRVSPKR